MFFFLLIYVMLALFTYLVYKANQSRDKAPPLIGHSLPIIGHLYYILWGDNAHFLVMLEVIFNEVLRRGGVVCRAMMGTKAFYFITDPEDCLTVANSCLSKPKMPYAFLNPSLGNGLLNVQDVHLWKPRRKVMNPVFSQQKLDEYLYVFNGDTRSLVEKLKKYAGAGPFDHTVDIKNLILESVVRTTLDIIEEDSESKNVIIRESTRLIELASMRITNMWLYTDFVYNLTAYGKEEKIRINRLYRYTEEIVNKKKMLLKELNTHHDDRKFKPFMDTLIELEESGVFTRKDIMDQILTIILAGYHATSGTVSLILCAVGTYLKVQDRIYAELLEIFGTSDRDVEKKDLAKLVYLEAVIKETMRLYPIVPIVTRLGDTEVRLKEYTIPKNSYYILLLNATNRLPIWGQDREDFRPERWLDPATIPQNANAFSSFSLGKRGCIGRTFSMNLMKVVCVHILRHFKIKSNINKIQMRLDLIYTFHSGHEISIESRL